jgi:hypothetical protein
MCARSQPGTNSSLQNRRVEPKQSPANLLAKKAEISEVVEENGAWVAGLPGKRRFHSGIPSEFEFDSNKGNFIVLPFWRLEVEIKLFAGPVPSEGSGKESVPYLSPSFLCFAGDLWHSLLYRYVTQSSCILPGMSGVSVKFPIFIRKSVTLNQAYSNDLILT